MAVGHYLFLFTSSFSMIGCSDLSSHELTPHARSGVSQSPPTFIPYLKQKAQLKIKSG